ncbi:MAG: hypothetical protein R3267_06240 [Paenisporosarcina sp.]|nr:hypothetical protein [Paenisporosarcina sp.]
MKAQQSLPFLKRAVEEERLVLDQPLQTYDFVKRECLNCGSKENLKFIVLEQDKRKQDANYDYSFLLCSDCHTNNNSTIYKLTRK